MANDQTEAKKPEAQIELLKALIAPHHQLLNATAESRVSLGKVGLQTLILMNSGSFIAFPTFINMANIDVSDNVALFSLSIAFFSMGLFFVVMAIYQSYLNLSIAYRSTCHDIDLIIDKYYKHAIGEEELHRKLIDERYLSMNRKAKESNSLSYPLAVTCSLISLLLFLAGVCAAGILVLYQ